MRPLGYWIKEIDRRIEADFARRLTGEGLTRRHWQVLHAIAEGVDTVAGLDDALAPFPTGTATEDLAGRGWLLLTADGTVMLTTSGREAHERVAAQVRETRARTVAGLSDADYVALVGMLERIAGNLAA